MTDFEKTFDKAGEVLDNIILNTPGLLEYKICDGILYLRFEHGIIDMTLPLVRYLRTYKGESWENIGEVETG